MQQPLGKVAPPKLYWTWRYIGFYVGGTVQYSRAKVKYQVSSTIMCRLSSCVVNQQSLLRMGVRSTAVMAHFLVDAPREKVRYPQLVTSVPPNVQTVYAVTLSHTASPMLSCIQSFL